MFDGICPNDRIFGSKFDQEQIGGFQMSVPSGILCSKRWKFVSYVSVLPKREVVSCLKEEFVASTCLRLPERASLAGFQASKQERPGPAGNPSVARWKSNSCCISNIIRRLPGIDAETLALPLLPPTRSLRPCPSLSPSTTCLRGRHTPIFPMPSVNCLMGGC